MAFRRTAISLIVIAFVTAGVAAVYLWYNFTAKSNLILVVPQNCHWFYHFQTKQIRSKTESHKPKYLDSIANLIAQMPAFKKVKDPGEVGVTLFSDIVVFENDFGKYLAVSVTSETRLQRFFNELVPKELTGGLVSGGSCNFAKATGRNLYFAFKHKALVLFQPNDTTDNLQILEKGLAEVFAEQSKPLVTAIPEVKSLYAKDCDVVFYTAKKNKVPSYGVVLDKKANIIDPQGKPLGWMDIMGMYYADGLPLTREEVWQYGNKTGEMATDTFLEVTLRSMYEYLKNY